MHFVIADIHGELTKLKSLLINILAIKKKPSFIFIGDYIDKGENPYNTLKYLTQFSIENECVFLRGNHEYYWELLKSNNDQYADYLIKYGGKNTIYSINKNLSILEAKDKLFDEFGTFFNTLRNFYVINKYVITHSGIPPELYSTEIENIKMEKLLFNRYDFIRNDYFFHNKKIIFGHTGFYSPFYDGYKIGIDTAACYLKEQPLTAFCIDQDFFINSNNDIIQLSNINQSICPAIPRVKAWRQI